MMRSETIRAWSFVHKWSSLVCTAFLLMLCLTGMPLIFHDEIEAALETEAWAPANPGGRLLTLDEILSGALARRPAGEVPVFMSFDEDRPVVNVTTAPRADSPGTEMTFAAFDGTSGAVVPPAAGHGVMDFILQLHTDMFLGLGGMLFLAAMGLLFVVATVSGVVLYAPFMRKLPFGTLRVERSRRTGWLDWHNLLGIVTLAWVLVVGLTGVVNALSTPIIGLWRVELMREFAADRVTDGQSRGMGSIHAAVDLVRRTEPDSWVQFVSFPGTDFSTDRHFAIFLQGDTPLTKHLLTAVLVDARTGALAGRHPMPWYVKVLALSGPLHFGDYGGLPLKILWALLNGATIVILGSGLYLWLRRAPLRSATGGDAIPARGSRA